MGIVRFAYVYGTRIEPARLQVAQRAWTLAQRRANDLQCLAENVYSKPAASRWKASTRLPK